MNKEQKNALLNAINNGLFFRPVVKWDEDHDAYVGYEHSPSPFSTLKELADGLRELADDLEMMSPLEK